MYEIICGEGYGTTEAATEEMRAEKTKKFARQGELTQVKDMRSDGGGATAGNVRILTSEESG